MVAQDFISRQLSPVLMNNYGQNVLGSTYNSVEFVFRPPGPLKCQIKQPFAATCNINPAQMPYTTQILQIRKSCPKPAVVEPEHHAPEPEPVGPSC